MEVAPGPFRQAPTSTTAAPPRTGRPGCVQTLARRAHVTPRTGPQPAARRHQTAAAAMRQVADAAVEVCAASAAPPPPRAAPVSTPAVPLLQRHHPRPRRLRRLWLCTAARRRWSQKRPRLPVWDGAVAGWVQGQGARPPRAPPRPGRTPWCQAPPSAGSQWRGSPTTRPPQRGSCAAPQQEGTPTRRR